MPGRPWTAWRRSETARREEDIIQSTAYIRQSTAYKRQSTTQTRQSTAHIRQSRPDSGRSGSRAVPGRPWRTWRRSETARRDGTHNTVNGIYKTVNDTSKTVNGTHKTVKARFWPWRLSRGARKALDGVAQERDSEA